MEVVSKSITQIEPVVVQCEWGGWLAVSQEGSLLRIGTVGATEEDAHRSFKAALEEWARWKESARGQPEIGSR